MTTIEEPGVGGCLAGDVALAPARRDGRRADVEAVSLLLGILGILLVVVVTLGTTPGLT